ncbi:MAG: S9 family peptidase, partial [Candidatus Eremiobacteraeota bacterium]|nr:S9 family peptidase [Candidatus Eremiobacteraeota bacterium]
NDLVIVDLQSGAQRTLLTNRPGLSSPAFSPDGTQLAFLADDSASKNSHTRVFVMPVSEGSARPVSPSDVDAAEFAWRPDGQAIAYAAADPEPEKSGAERFRDSFVFTTEPITAREFPAPIHLFIAQLGAENTAQLTFGSPSIVDGSPLSWSPDGAAIAVTLSRNAILNDQSYSWAAIVDVASKRVRALTGRSMWEGDARFSPDGRHIAYLYSAGDPQIALSELYVTTPSGGTGTRISGGLDRNIGDFAWSADSHTLIATGPDRTTNAFYRIALDRTAERLDVGAIVPGTPLNTTGGADVPSLSNALADDGTLVFLASSTAQPLELFKYVPGAGASKVTDFNVAMSRIQWAEAQRITFRSATGVTADGVLYMPPSFSPSRRYPLVVYIHGGPGDPSMLEFDFWAQVMAARGWLVLRPNYRGSPNLGLSYQRAILYDPEGGPGRDIMAAIASVRRLGIVDTSRIGVCGWSYGGIMTAWMISKYHIWRAAVSGASVDDWITDYGTADDSLADVDMLHGSPFVGNNAAEWRRISPISYARDVTTPVLILSDTGDNRDPFATSSMYWRALRDNHKDATLRVWPVDGHFPDDPVRIADIFHYWIEYLADHFR